MSEDLFPGFKEPLAYERYLWAGGWPRVAGVDEVGRGALAGPVVAAAVILCSEPEALAGVVRDSKELSPARREELLPLIERCSAAIGIGAVEPSEIDRLNILRASLAAMQIALARLDPPPDLCLIDGNQRVPTGLPQRTIVGGDRRVLSISAASIVAKVFRDRLMVEAACTFPGYGFEKHKGYGTALHLAAIRRLGASPLHRRSFSLPPDPRP